MAYLARASVDARSSKRLRPSWRRKGLSAVTARTVAEQLGCSQGQIHHHFSSTDERPRKRGGQYSASEIDAYEGEVQ